MFNWHVNSCITVLVFVIVLTHIVASPPFTLTVYGEETSLYKWVIMMYIPADNSYEASYNESYVGEVLNEITGIHDLSDDLKITVFLDTYGDYCKIYSIENSNEGVKLVPQEVLGECNTGDPRVLEYFINYTLSRFKGEYYGLFIIDHSNSWVKDFNHIHFISLDENPGESDGEKDLLNFNELVSAISQYSIDVLFFDVDHYLSIDSYLELSLRTNVGYVVGSPLHVYGLRYRDLFMEFSRIVGSATPKDLAELIVSIASEYNVNKEGFVLSAFKLNSSIASLYIDFVREINYLFRAYPDKMIEIFDTSLKNTPSYYTPLPRIYVDLGIFINRLQEAVSQDPYFGRLSTILSRLYEQLIDLRISYSSHTIFINSIGLALYFPVNPYDYLEDRVWFTNSFTNIGSLLWVDMLSSYYSIKYPELNGVEIEFMVMRINDKVFALIYSSINKKPVDLEEIKVTVYNISNGSLILVKEVDNVERIRKGTYIADLGLEENVSSNIIVKVDVQLAFICMVYYYQLDIVGLYYTLDTFTDEVTLLKTNMLRIGENVSALKTIIGEVKTNLDNVKADLDNVEASIDNIVGNIEFFNNSIAEIILKTNKTIYGRLILLEEDIAKIKTDIGDLYIDLNVLRDNVASNLSTLNRKADEGFGKIDLLHYITSFIVIEVGLLFSIVYSRKHSLVS